MAKVWGTMKTTLSSSVSSSQLRSHPSCLRLVSLMSPASTAFTAWHTPAHWGCPQVTGHQKWESWWLLVIKMTSAIGPAVDLPASISISSSPCPSVQCQCSGKLSLGPGVSDTLWSWAVKMSKKSIAGPSYGGLKKVVAKSYTKWGLPSLNGRHGHKLWRNQKISMPISKRIAWRLFWAVKFFKKVYPSLSYGRSKFGSKSWYFCYVFRPLCHFFWFSLFSLPLCIFFGNFLSNPPQKIRPEGTPALKGLALLRNAVAPSGLRPFGTDFLGGVIKL